MPQESKTMQLPTVTADAMALNAVASEMQRARSLHNPYSSSHEAYAVILEELDEFWDEVKKKTKERNPANMAKELVQIATTALLSITDLKLTYTLKTGE